MEYPVFYSWQNNLRKKCNRTLIRESLDEAVRRVDAEGQVEDSPRVDSGMEGVAGSPEVASIMFEKIDRCALFVADTTLVGTIAPATSAGETKRVPVLCVDFWSQESAVAQSICLGSKETETIFVNPPIPHRRAIEGSATGPRRQCSVGLTARSQAAFVSFQIECAYRLPSCRDHFSSVRPRPNVPSVHIG
jgi:hypothetical protein